MKKSDFVHSRLSPLLRALDNDILAIDVSGLGNDGITELVVRRLIRNGQTR